MPASRRLTNAARRQIRDHLLEQKFTEREGELSLLEAEIADLAYEVYITPTEMKYIKKLPRGMFDTSSSISVAVDGQQHDFDFCKRATKKDPHRKQGEERLTGDDLSGWRNIPDRLSLNTRTASGKKKELADAVTRWVRESEAIKNEKAEVRNNIDAVLDSSTTRRNLIKAWPEIEPTLDRIWTENDESVAPTKALAVSMTALNQSLDLPEPEAAEVA